MSRHLFHRRYRKPIFFAFVFVAAVGLKLLFYLPNNVIIYGCILLCMVGVYFLSIWLFRVYFAKELFIAVLYSCGIFLGVYALGHQFDLVVYIYFIELCLLAFINLLLFSYFEVDKDKEDGHHSWVTHFGKNRTMKHLVILFSTIAILCPSAYFFIETHDEFTLQTIFLLMALILGLIYVKPERFSKEEQFRWIGDMIFILPVLIFLL